VDHTETAFKKLLKKQTFSHCYVVDIPS